MENGSDGQAGLGKAIMPAAEVDCLLAGMGYSIRPSDLCHVAERLEKLDSALIAAASAGLPPEFLCSDAVHFNPSDLAAWVDSMATLTELQPDHFVPTQPAPVWSNEICPPAPPLAASVSAVAEIGTSAEKENEGIRLVHLLMTCADFIDRGDRQMAVTLIEEMRLLLPRVGTIFGIGKVAGYFVDALNRRLHSPTVASTSQASAEDEILYHHYFYEASPYLKFAHFTANQAILDAFNGQDRVHVIDFSLMHGLQWPALIQALALRPGRPPFLRLTGIGPPSADGRDALRDVGQRLADLARSVGVPFAFRSIVSASLDEIRPAMLRVEHGEAVAINSVLQFHRLLSDPGSPGPIDSVLSWVGELQPLIVTVVEQEADHNRPAFLDRFTEALFYYSTVFDSLEAGASAGRQAAELAAFAELFLQKEICNIVCCEGTDRVERHEPLASWRTRFGQAGFLPAHVGSNAFRQASMLLTLFSGEGYCVEEVDGCLTLGWHGRAVISVSAWHPSDHVAAPPAGNRFFQL